MSEKAPPPRLDGSALTLGIVVSRFNEHVTCRLLAGALEGVRRHRVARHEVVWAPGSFELPQAAQYLARSGKFDAIVCLGAVIRHETDHYLHVATQAAAGIQRVALDTGVPCIFGVLTCDTDEQALARAGGVEGNKGLDALEAAIEMANLRRGLASGEASRE